MREEECVFIVFNWTANLPPVLNIVTHAYILCMPPKALSFSVQIR